MTTEHNEGFAEGFKAGWDAAFSHFSATVNKVSPRPAHPPQFPNGGFATSGAPIGPRTNDPDPNNPWYAHNLGHRLTPEEYAHFQGQMAGSVNLHTTTPEYDQEDASMHQTTRVY